MIVDGDGLILMKPASPAVTHHIQFVNVNESLFVGGGMDPVPTDVGLWVMGNGRLDIAGTTKTSWTNLAGGAAAGATSITLREAPVGWQVGDEISVAPTEPPSVGEASYKGFDPAKITSINGATVTLDKPLARAHPNNISRTAEVMNLSRNVVIGGTLSGGRAHVFIRSTTPQSIKNALLWRLGPRQPTGEKAFTGPVLGRYSLHFHHSMDGSRGSIVEGVVAKDGGSHDFVPHHSHGITMRDSIAYNGFEDAFWWDPMRPAGGTAQPDNFSNDIVWDHNIVAIRNFDPEFRGYRLSGFFLGLGANPVLRNSVAVGVRGNTNASGFQWPEPASSVWTFHDNIAHNNKVNGIFVWQNVSEAHLVERTQLYNNGGAGVALGAYVNLYQFRDIVTWGNAGPEFLKWASQRGTGDHRQVFENVNSLGGTLHLGEHPIAPRGTSLWLNCQFNAVMVDIARDAQSTPTIEDFVNCDLEPDDFIIQSWVQGSRIRVQRPDGTAFQIDSADGTPHTIPAFYP